MEDSMRVSNGEYELSIFRDEDAESPREWDNLGKMVCWHRRYSLGDKHDFDSPQDFYESSEYKDIFVILPIYLYDHSGITISNDDFGDRWDSGQVGYIYATKDSIRKIFGKEPSQIDHKEIIEQLKGETTTYDQYLQGDVYGFTIENNQGEVVDSCSGFYGGNIADVLQEMKAYTGEEHEGLFSQVERHSSVVAAMM